MKQVKMLAVAVAVSLAVAATAQARPQSVDFDVDVYDEEEQYGIARPAFLVKWAIDYSKGLLVRMGESAIKDIWGARWDGPIGQMSGVVDGASVKKPTPAPKYDR